MSPPLDKGNAFVHSQEWTNEPAGSLHKVTRRHHIFWYLPGSLPGRVLTTLRMNRTKRNAGRLVGLVHVQAKKHKANQASMHERLLLTLDAANKALSTCLACKRQLGTASGEPG
jgi:hypothetical protein